MQSYSICTYTQPNPTVHLPDCTHVRVHTRTRAHTHVPTVCVCVCVRVRGYALHVHQNYDLNVSNSITNLFYSLQQIEQTFWCGGSSHEDVIRSVITDIRTTMENFNVTYIHASYQISEIHLLAQNKTHDKLALDSVTDYHKTLLQFVPNFFTPLIEDLKQCTACMKRYLLSFFHGKRDAYVEIAVHYEMKRREMERIMNHHMKNIDNMANGYKSQRGLHVKMFGFGTNELARKCDVGDVPFILVFPEACANIRNSCEAAQAWIKADEEYAEFLKMDILELERKRDSQLRTVRECHHNQFQCEHKVKLIQKHIQELENNIARLRHRDIELTNQLQQLEKAKYHMKLDIEIKEQDRDELRSIHDHERISKLANEISDLRFKLPDMDRKIDSVRHKMSILAERKDLLKTKTAELGAKQAELKKQNRLTKDAAHKLARIEDAIVLLKEIYNRKISDDATKKIFHDLPIEPRNARLLPAKLTSQNRDTQTKVKLEHKGECL